MNQPKGAMLPARARSQRGGLSCRSFRYIDQAQCLGMGLAFAIKHATPSEQGFRLIE
jgi:hypothetical protein